MRRVRIVARTTEPFRCIGGVPVMADAALDEARDARIVCLPDFRIDMLTPPRDVLGAEIDWSRADTPPVPVWRPAAQGRPFRRMPRFRAERRPQHIGR